MNAHGGRRGPGSEDRGLTDTARRLLMARFGLTEAQANEAIRRAAAGRGAPLIEVVREVLDTGYLPGLPAGAAVAAPRKPEARRPQRGGRHTRHTPDGRRRGGKRRGR